MSKTEIISVEEYKKLKNKKRNKYGAKKVTYRGEEFDSQLERDYFIVLQTRIKLRIIKKVEIHKRVDLIVNDQLICFMKVDFVITNNDDSISYHDTKGMVTANFRLKAKLFKALIGKQIKIIKEKDL